jgi:hypothetical protein
MDLPAGVKCGDCAHDYRCRTIFGGDSEMTYCQFFPRRFVETIKATAEPMPPAASTIRVWMRKELDVDGDAITAFYLDAEGFSFFGSIHNRDAKRHDFPHVSRKDVGLVPAELTIGAGHLEDGLEHCAATRKAINV